MGGLRSRDSISAQVGKKPRMEYISGGSDNRKICSSVPPEFGFLAVVRAKDEVLHSSFGPSLCKMTAN